MIARYPVTTRLYGIGTPTIVAAGAFGWPFGFVTAIVAAAVCLFGWSS